jgi:hypothetical protein
MRSTRIPACGGSSGINNALRELARQVRAAVANQGNDVASAATTNIGAATGQYVRVTGTTTITSLGTVNAGVMRWVEFAGVLTLTHNGTSLKLPGSANILTVAGDIGLFVSLGSGNWKCLNYSKADGSPVSLGSAGTVTSSDGGATEGPDFIADRNSASPAASDVIGGFVMRGRDSGANVTDYARMRGVILDPANTGEDGQAIISALINAVETDILKIGPGVQVGSPTGGDKGPGTINAADVIYQDGVNVGAFSTQLLHVRDEKANGTDGGTSTAAAWTKHTLDDVKSNEISGASQASSVVTLPVGTYYIDAWAALNRSNGAKLRWRNTSDGTTAVVGANGHETSGGQYTQVSIPLRGRFTVSGGSKNFELQYFVEAGLATTGLGFAVTSGEVEIYGEAMIWKIA